MSTHHVVRSRFAHREVAGVPFAVSSIGEAADWLIQEAVPQRIPVNVRLANAYNVALADDDPSYASLLAEQGVNFPDGTPVVWYMNRQRGRHVRAERVRGPSLFTETMARSANAGTRHFLLGSTPDTLRALEDALRASHPGITIVGSFSPPFAPVDDEYLDICSSEVQGAEPDIVWVGLGTPKQDIVGTEVAMRAGIPTVNVGAAFDFAAGTVREAPVWIQRSGFEWLYRLTSEPKRLWRRYFFGNVRFLYAATIFESRRTGGRTSRPSE
ncbi:N-acetylglucosaminyldiphosphoundecaprenol N-acetyl-beta-D-mannosaminyltransferase [Microbacterium trichothecenolyticum]|uniref:WecB/TagA/CpsF family glycosyltransferase n=1 Tax=Microbacterium trichothecenolyticum TaxID=69370 RepID=UPI00285857B6|nr:WecB/TagA/CpsF family glycosyltransferase [Microbacterium trichothecenolyticum]MDR7112932.1 N-acetylglucosaminyldiphosphoundecaprenol N-acetyl-beta-D-mannosaminyltransferase [Microbacterium trichothecenolyticum]